MDYADFLKEKRRVWTGEPLPLPHDAHPLLFPFQQALVAWAMRKGRCALWAGTGLGKTAMQLVWADRVRQSGGRALILAPLAVNAQTVREAVKFGVPAHAARGQSDVRDDSVTVANYDMLHHFDASQFDAVVLDESSILKSYSGTTKQALVEAFASTRYKLCCTATPAPNDYLELGNHAEFLGIMPSTEMIMRWFTNDPMEAGRYTLKPHGAADFWRWVSSWALSLEKPSDIGYPDEAFALPPLRVVYQDVGHVEMAPTAGRLFAEPALSATDMHQTLRASSGLRATAAAARINAEPDEAWLVWVNTDYDADALRALVPDLVEVKGPDSADVKAARLLGFADGSVRRLMTKPSVAGFGMNWQRCARVVFMGLSFSFEQFYQALRRTWRFGQTREVLVYAFLSEQEVTLRDAIATKERQHAGLMRDMIAASREGVMGELSAGAQLVEHRTLRTEQGDGWTLTNGDCVEVIGALADDSLDYSVFSPPFSNLYIYSDAQADMGNAQNHDEFFVHFGFLLRELYRATVPGRLMSIHCKDLPRFQNRDGAAGLYDFAGETIRAAELSGWQYHSRVTIWKDPVIEMQRTNNHGLLYKQLRADSTASRQGMADYLLTFRKWGSITKLRDFPRPVTHTREDFPLDQWQKWASPVWDDIQQTRVLPYQGGREDEDQRHICPLQLDVIERCIRLWSNPGDLVCSPFTGIGSEGYEAVRLGRRFVGAELKPSYFTVACRMLREAEGIGSQGTLFADTAQEA